jgi:hypothetical protein
METHGEIVRPWKPTRVEFVEITICERDAAHQLINWAVVSGTGSNVYAGQIARSA